MYQIEVKQRAARVSFRCLLARVRLIKLARNVVTFGAPFARAPLADKSQN